MSPARTDTSPDVAYDWLRHHALYNPDDLAAVDLSTGRRFTYAEFDERCTRLATGMQKEFAVGRGDRVAFVAHNSSDHFECMFACWKLGAIFIPVNWRLHSVEAQTLIAHASPRLVICDEEFTAILDADMPNTLTRRTDSEQCGYETLIRNHEALATMPVMHYDDANTLLYTSGTTATPKGVIYTWRMTMNIVLQAALHAELSRYSRTLVFAPLFHTAALNSGAMSLFHYGGTVYVMKHWDAKECLQHLSDPVMGISHCNGVPTNYIMMSEQPEFAAASFPALRFAGVGSAPVSASLLDTWLERNVAMVQSYGMTEAFSVALTPPHRARDMLGSAGHTLMHVEVQIGNDKGTELPRGETGEIQIRGPGVTPGYWEEPELSANAFVDGWFRSGDAGRMQADGTIFVVDRLKDMYISGGENIYPAEIEHVIMQLAAVSQAAVIGIPHEKWTEAGLALVKLRENAVLETAEIIAHCRSRLAGFKVPKAVVIVDSLPISPQGKVRKRELQEQYSQTEI
ncbi:MAG: class I adenylate-forming enzyme family protein [Gammaproteobacteria bacterium]